MRRVLAVMSVVLSLAASAAAAGEPPSGWRPPSSEERSRHPSPDRLVATGDFDGDGRADRAVLLVNDRLDQIGLFVVRGGSDRYEALDTVDEAWRLPDVSVSAEEPGLFRTACAKGYGPPCARDEPTQVETKQVSIGLTYAESSFSIFHWDGRGFAQVWITD